MILKIYKVGDGTTYLDLETALSDPDNFFHHTGGNYIFNLQTWYSDSISRK